MDLETEAFLAVVKVRLVHTEIDLAQYQKALSYATPEMEAFDILLDRVKELVADVKFYRQKLMEV